MNRFLTGALLAASISAVAQAAAPGAPSLAGVRACRALTDSAARLACYDRETDALDSVSAPPAARVPAAPAASVATPAPVAPVISAQQKFGLPEGAVVAKEVAAGARAADVPKIEARLVRVTAAADSRLVFTLDNQQVWRQVKAEGELLAKVGDAVIVHRGALGSYWLQFPSGRGCKVSRVQ